MIPNIPGISSTDSKKFFLLAGPCVVESRDIVFQTAEVLKEITESLGIPFVFKASYRKANRTKSDSFMGIGDELALVILNEIREQFEIPVVTDVHTNEECALAANYVDVLQIPAFLSRQTELLQAAAKTGKWVNIKKGQFLSGEMMKHAAQKVLTAGNKQVMLTERGNSFGYNDLIVDFKNIPVMKTAGFPVVMDCTHSLQEPNRSSGVTGGQPQYIELMARCAIAAGADGLFIETHPEPSRALSDGANMLPLDRMKKLLESAIRIREAIV